MSEVSDVCRRLICFGYYVITLSGREREGKEGSKAKRSKRSESLLKQKQAHAAKKARS